jgi:hypothetical protein
VRAAAGRVRRSLLALTFAVEIGEIARVPSPVKLVGYSGPLGFELGPDAGLDLLRLEDMVVAEVALGGGGAREAGGAELAGVDERWSLGSILLLPGATSSLLDGAG